MPSLFKNVCLTFMLAAVATAIAAEGAGASAKRVFHIMPHSHIDVEWYWTAATTRSWSKEIFDQAVKLFHEHPSFRFTQDQIYLIREYWDACSADEKAFLRKMIAEDRLALVGGMFVMPEVAEPSGEALIRQILLGQQWLMKTFAMRSRCGWFIDTFGQIPQIPQILKRCGFDYNFFWRDIPPEADFAAMPTNFFWQAPDGSKILTHWLAGGYDFGYKQLEVNLAHQTSGHLLVPFGSDVAKPPQHFDEVLEKTADLLKRFEIHDPEMQVVHAVEYMDTIAATAADLPILTTDFNPPLRAADLRGTYDNRIELKKRNRRAESALFNAEVLATLHHTPYPQAVMQSLWEKLLLTHFHDIIGGSHHDPVYVEAMSRLQSILAETEAITQQSLPTDPSQDLLTVFNTCSFPRDELCTFPIPSTVALDLTTVALQDERGQLCPVRILTGSDSSSHTLQWLARAVPPLASSRYQIVNLKKQIRAPFIQDHIENEFYAIKWNTKTGDLISIYDKKLASELLAAPGNAIIAMQEKNPDLEGPLYFTGEEHASAEYEVSSIVCQEDELGITLTMLSPFQDCMLERSVFLYHGLARIDFQTIIKDFVGGDVMIKVRFPLHLQQDKISRVYETPFAATTRPSGHYAAQTWVDGSDGQIGVALLNQGTPGYWLQENNLEMVLLRSFSNYAHYQKAGLRKQVPGYETSTQTELAREHGSHTFSYSLLSHRGNWQQADLFHLGQSINVPLVVKQGKGMQSSFLSFTPDFIMTALKPAQDGRGLIVRGFECSGSRHEVTLRVSPSIKRVQQTDLLEKPLQRMKLRQEKIKFTCAPHEIVTFLLQ